MRTLKAPFHQVLSLSRLSRPTSCLRKRLSTTQNLNFKQNGFGICIDIDGVVLRGKAQIPGAKDAMKMLTDKSGKFIYPVVFLTNSSIPEHEKATEISEIFDIEAKAEQFVMATSPLQLFNSFHKKKCLFLGQDNLPEMAKRLGFSNVCTIEQVLDTFPLLDAISHKRRPYITEMSKQSPSPAASSWKPVEAIILFTSPLQWESVLQLTSDLLLTQGDPRRNINATDPLPQLPVIVCNPDMQFMHASHLPRFAHGSFVLCLEQIYKKLTGRNLEYSALLGKPSEASFRFAEYRLHKLSRSIGIQKNITSMYMIGDNQEVDVIGGNMYHRYVTDLRNNNASKLPKSRTLPHNVDLGHQTVQDVRSYLVKTGVYQDNPEKNAMNHTDNTNATDPIIHSHRDFNITKELLTPYKICEDVYEAIQDILIQEKA